MSNKTGIIRVINNRLCWRSCNGDYRQIAEHVDGCWRWFTGALDAINRSPNADKIRVRVSALKADLLNNMEA